MNCFPCPDCDSGTMVEEVVAEYEARLGGVTFKVPNARIHRCSDCNGISVDAQELKRWRKIRDEHLATLGQAPSPAEVRKLRERLGLSVATLANLLGVTRQTVHAWERENGQGVPFSPSSLLVRMLQVETDQQLPGIFSYLLDAARQRGSFVDPEKHVSQQANAEPSAASAAPRQARLRQRLPGSPTFREAA